MATGLERLGDAGLGTNDLIDAPPNVLDCLRRIDQLDVRREQRNQLLRMVIEETVIINSPDQVHVLL